MVDPIILLLGIIYQIQELDVASCISTVDWSLRFNIEYKQELDAKKQIVEPLMIEQSGSFRVYTQDQVQCWQELAVKFMKTDSDDIWLNLQNEIQEIEEIIYEFELKLEFYGQVSARNFWQYLWSMKWTKNKI